MGIYNFFYIATKNFPFNEVLHYNWNYIILLTEAKKKLYKLCKLTLIKENNYCFLFWILKQYYIFFEFLEKCYDVLDAFMPWEKFSILMMEDNSYGKLTNHDFSPIKIRQEIFIYLLLNAS